MGRGRSFGGMNTPGRATEAAPSPPVREIATFTTLALALAWVVHVPVLLMGEGPGGTAYRITSGLFMLTRFRLPDGSRGLRAGRGDHG